ncbi:hypothetical protein POM88_024350 [Heracleum sosnowskyi]|uniref:DUF4378 domain-containing protein n=1 Tax=Heracleum sosnowskyi TaxID=360622 RepID=A0AAD8I2Y0_9APIA|nr:hypothetical protein POM88_024350 [Heracleum sosnowskyi]
MLNRMQEASQYTTRLKKKEKEKIVCFAGEVGIGSSSDRFGYQNYQNSRFSDESSSSDCYDELRKVIKESLGRHNLLPNGSVNSNAYFGREETELSNYLLSGNSNRTSTTYSHDSASVSSSSSNISEDRIKASNVIAKLMGLEEISSTTLQFEPRKQPERDKNLNPKGLIFDIDMPKRRKPWLAAQNGDRDCMTLEEIIQNMQFKGLLNRDQFQIYDSLTSESEKRFRNHAPPVVLMKPVHTGVGANDLFSHKFIPREGDVDFDRQSMSETKEDSTSRNFEGPDKGTSHLNKTCIGKITETDVAKPNRKALQKSADNKVKLTNSVSPRLQKGTIDKKVDKVQKSTSRRKSVEKENVKSTGLLKHREQPQRVSKSHEHLSPHAMKMRKSKLINKTLATNVQSIVHKDGDHTHSDQRKKASLDLKDTTPAPQLFAAEESDDSEILIKDIYIDSPDPHCEDTLHATQHETDTSCPEEATKSSKHHQSESTYYETKTSSSNILPRSFSFLTRVEDLFDNIDTYEPIVLQVLTGLHGCDGTNSKLLMDCANELLESRSQRNIPSIHPLIQRPLENPSFSISTEHLMQEVQNGIESLINYRNRARESILINSVSALLENDLWCIGRNIEAWDAGWRDEFTGDEVHDIACDLDMLILGELVAEVLAEHCS